MAEEEASVAGRGASFVEASKLTRKESTDAELASSLSVLLKSLSWDLVEEDSRDWSVGGSHRHGGRDTDILVNELGVFSPPKGVF